MKIGVDMDSVLAEIISPLDQFHNEIYNTSVSYSDHKEYRLDDLWKCSEAEVVQRIHDFYRSKYFDLIAPIEGAIEGVEKLVQRHTLILITSRPYFIESKSHEWLDKYFPEKFSKIVHTNQMTHKHEKKKKKSEICLEEGVKLMIEDNLEFAQDCIDYGIDVLLLPAPWNVDKTQLHPNIKRVESWKKIVALLCS